MRSVEVVQIDCWSSALKHICQFAYSRDFDRHKRDFIYRGLDRFDDPLLNGLQRFYRAEYILELEQVLLRNFKKYAHSMVRQPDMSEWQWVSIARHYGLPTRLIDWTFSPLVAMYFATQNSDFFDSDGVIWRIHIDELALTMPSEQQKHLREKLARVFSVSMLKDLGLDYFSESRKNAEREGQETVLIFEPPSLDERIVNQHACFTMMSDARSRLDSWLQRHPHLVTKYRISAKAKREIADSLDACNINPRVLFPGLQGLAETLRRRYGPWRVSDAD